MIALKVLELMRQHNICPKCGNSKIGNGEGKLIIEDNTYLRECKCGFKIQFDKDGKEII